VNNYFSFIPLKKLASLASNLVYYKWLGWSMLFSGALIMIISSRKPVNKLNRSSSN
jgi:hypothetical protein